MKSTHPLILTLALGAAVLTSNAVSANEEHAKTATNQKTATGRLVPVSEKDAAWAAAAKAKYPTDTCIVSGDKLGGDMGKPADFIYREEGKPDRLVSLCCKDCVKDFNKDPQKYLPELDEATAKKSTKSTN